MLYQHTVINLLEAFLDGLSRKINTCLQRFSSDLPWFPPSYQTISAVKATSEQERHQRKLNTTADAVVIGRKKEQWPGFHV